MINQLDIYRAGVIFATVDIDEGTVFNEKLPGTELIACPIKTLAAIDFQEGDYIIHKGIDYKINIIPDFGKSSDTRAKSYKINFEAPFYDLLDMYIQDSTGAHTFPYYASAQDQLQLIVDNANRVTSGWSVGEVEVTEAQLLSYDWTYVRTSLDDIASAFGLEWKAKGKVINMVKTIGHDTGLIFEFGRGKGLYEITRSADTTKSVVNKVYGVGGTKNITAAYRGGVEPNLVFEERFVTTPGVTAGTERAKEGKYENLEIYPRFEGTVTSTTLIRDADNNITGCTITDPSIDFDINTHLQEGVKATVSFRTGPLTAVEFEISNFDYATKTATLINNTDTNGYVLPNELNFPEVGNKFTFLNIIMPAEYFVTWEAKLKEATLLYLDQNKLQRVTYGVVPDEKQLRDNNIQLSAGDRANTIDTDLDIDEILRFTEITYPLVNEFKVTGTIGNDITYDRVTKLFADVLNNTQQIQNIDLRGQEIAKRGAANLRVLADSIFDVEGNFDSDKFNVGVLSALLGIFGIQSANFLLNKVFITANFGGDPNSVNISAGELFHLEYSNAGNQNVWQMQAVTQNALVPGTGYYVYSKLSKTSQVGTFLITTDQIKPDDISGYYTVRTGFIYPQIDGWRDVDFTYGITTVNGRQIKTGIIQGNTNALIINLDTGEIFGKLTFRASNGSIKEVAAVDNTASLAQINALAAQSIADAANTQSAAALAQLSDISNDGILDVSEKVSLKTEYEKIYNELAPIRDGAAIYGLPTSNFTNAWGGIVAHFQNDWLANMTVNTPVDRTLFYSVFTDYYTKRQLLLQATSNSAKALADGAQSLAGVANANAVSAQANATIALAELSDIASDAKLTPNEKIILSRDFAYISQEYPIRLQEANPYLVPTAAYTNAYNALVAYVNNNGLLTNMSATTDINSNDFKNAFANYYGANVALTKAISDAAKHLVDNIQVGGRNLLRGTAQSISKVDYGLAYSSVITSPMVIGRTYILTGNVVTQGANVSFPIFSSTIPQNYMQLDTPFVADAAYSSFAVYNELNGTSLQFDHLKLEEGNVPTSWTAAPEDIQEQLDNVIELSEEALRIINDFSDDSILNASEKKSLLQDLQVINAEYSTLIAQAATYGVNSNEYTANRNFINNQANNVWLLGNGQDTPIDRDQFRAQWTTYYKVKVDLVKAITDASKAGIDVAIANAATAQGKADAAKIQADTAIAQLNDISNDGILDVSEKTSLRVIYNQIYNELAPIRDGAAKYALSTSDYTNAWGGIIAYFQNDWLANSTVNTPVDRVLFNNTFNDYYSRRQSLLQATTDAAKNLIDKIKAGGNNIIKNSNFYNEFVGWGVNGTPGVAPGIYDGKPGLSVTSNSSGSGIFTSPTQLIKANTDYTVSFDIKGMFYEGRTFLVGIEGSPVLQNVVVPSSANWSRSSFTLNSGAYSGSNSFVFYNATGLRQDYIIRDIQVAEGNDDSWSAAPEDIQTQIVAAQTAAVQQANTFAESIATSKANAAQAAAQASASSDAQAKADAAYNNAVSASNTYANTAANNAAGAAQTAAAADASNKATAAYNNAQAAANAQYNALTGSLKGLAYRDIQLAAGQGVTVIDNGSVVSFLVDAAYIRANVITAGYINTLSLDAGTIQTGTLSANRIDVNALVVKNIKTADVGIKHVEINGSDNNIRVLDAGNNILIEIDDDSALEGIQASTGQRIYGPGIRVGIDGSQAGYLGRKNLLLTDSSGNRQNFIGVDLNGQSKVQFDTTGGVIIKNNSSTFTGLPSFRFIYKDSAGANSHFTVQDGWVVEAGAGS